MDYLASTGANLTSWYWLIDKLSEAAERNEALDVQPSRTVIVASNSVIAFVNRYIQANPGTTYICYGRSGTGKTMAALHLIHGEHDNRPRRAIMVNAGGDNDFPEYFARMQNAPEAAPFLANILCAALVFDEKKKESADGIGVYAWTLFTKIRRLIKDCHERTIDQPSIALQQSDLLEIGVVRARQTRTDLPLLIIDDFAESSPNRNFLSSLYIQASALEITVLVLTKDADWGTRMVEINGGVKILPMDEVIRNPRGDSVEPFEEEPDWTGMGWNLRDLQNFAATLGHPDISEELHEGMTPQAVQELHIRRTRLF